MHGLDAVSLKMYSYITAEWASGPLYAAMEEAYDAGKWDSSGYGGNAWKTDGDAFEVAAKEYLFLLNFGMFEYSSLWDGGSLAPEWTDDMRTQSGIQTNNPLGYALHNTYIAPVISKPSLTTIRNIFQDGDVGDPTVAGVSGYVVTGGAIALTDLSVGTEGSASGNGAIAYNNSTGVFTYTPPDLSSYLTSVAFSDLTSTPTTLAGYGITDADVSGNANITGNTGVTGNLTVNGNSGVDGDHSVTGNSSLNGTLSVTGDTTLSSNVNVGGDANITGNNTVTGNSSVAGNSSVVGNLNVTGDTTLAGNSSVAGNADVTGNLDITGTLTVSNKTINTPDTSTGGANSGTATALDVTKTLQVLNSADGDDDWWSLADGTEGQIMHFVPGTGAGTDQHKVTIANWRRWDSGAGVAGEWVIETNLDWLPFKLDFDGTRWTGVATAIFTDGAWQTNNPWID
jgi:hypothetical protein